MVNDIFKARGCKGCISAALNVYSTNAKKIFKATYLWVLALALVSGAAVVGLPPLAVAAVGVVVFLLDARVTAALLKMLTDADLRTLYLKTVKVKLVGLAAALVVLSAVGGTVYALSLPKAVGTWSTTTYCLAMSAAGGAVALVFMLLYSPLLSSVTRYVFSADAKFAEIFGKPYRDGLRRLGFLFSLSLAMGLLCLVFWLLLCVPGCITNFAETVDGYGVAAGDKSGLPSYFVCLNFLSTFFMAIIMQYIMIWVTLTLFYAYGSVESLNNNN